MWKKYRRIAFPLFLCLVVVVTALSAIACGDDEGTDATTKPTIADKDKIVIGQVRSLEGVHAFYEANAFGPVRNMWVEQVNADGGIYVEEYGKKLPVEMLIYNDSSDMDTCVQLYEKLMTEDKVDFIFGPNSTAFNFAVASVANQHGYMMMTCEGGARTIEEMIPDLPLFFGVLNYSTTEIPALAEVLQEVGAQTIAIAYQDDLHGLEYRDMMVQECEAADIEIVYDESFPMEASDFTGIIQQVQALDPDCFFFPGYPNHNYPLVGQLMQAGYNPKMLVMGPGTTFGAMPAAMGGEAGMEAGYAVCEGVVGYGAWSLNSGPEYVKLHEDLLMQPNFTEGNMDYWGHAFYMAEVQIFQQAIEKAGTLDNAAVAEVMKTERFQTILGDTWFENQILAEGCHPGQVGQWQNGMIEVIDVGEKRTAEPIYPKPPWPAP